MNTQVELIVCSTCGSSERDATGRTRGERLLAQLETSAAELAAPVAMSSVRCLWSCKRSCSVHLRSPGRVSYVLGDLDESEAAARGLLQYASLYGQSDDGAVPFKQWPDAVRGHFVCRLPALPSPESTPATAPGTGAQEAKESP